MGRTKKGTGVIKTSANFVPTKENMEKMAQESGKNLEKTIEKLKKKKFEIKPNNDPDYINVKCISFRKKQNNEPQLVYEVCYTNNKQPYLKTGNYIGYLSVGEIVIDIGTGYEDEDGNDYFLNRMLNVANNILFDSYDARSAKKTDVQNRISYLLTYMFISTFRKAIAMGVPSQYKKIVEHGLNVRGRISMKDYITRDMIYGYKLTYSYNQLTYVQEIIDVLYTAMDVIKKNNSQFLSRDLEKYYNQLKQLYSGKRPSHGTIRNVTKHKALLNPIYGPYKKALKWAVALIENENINYSDEGEEDVSGLLLDVSELWEVYLANLLERRFAQKGYNVIQQEEIKLYKDTFFARPNYPDILLENKNENTIVVLDAKFKKMDFTYDDVDRGDLFQINHYVGYYKLKYDQVKFASLVYPVRETPKLEKDKLTCPLYGLENESNNTQFIISYLKIGHDEEETKKYENAFLDRMEQYFDGNYNLDDVQLDDESDASTQSQNDEMVDEAV